MSMDLWIAIGIIGVIVWGVIILEVYHSPVYSDDYINEEEAEHETSPQYEKSPPNSQTDRGTTRNVAGFPPTVDPDDEWMMDHQHAQTVYQIRDLEKRLLELHEYSDIAIDQSAQREYLRVEKKLKHLKDSLPSA